MAGLDTAKLGYSVIASPTLANKEFEILVLGYSGGVEFRLPVVETSGIAALRRSLISVGKSVSVMDCL
jgi:hypothetical protein